MKHVCLDLETFGTNPFAVIISIGAVHFDDDIKAQFHVAIDPSLSAKAGFRVDMDTIQWWLDPDRADAYKSWLSMPRCEPQDALQGFSQWLQSLFGPNLPDTWQDQVVIWGNGPAFDNEILRNGYKLLGLDVPWSFRNDRCFRTIKSLPVAKDCEPEREGTIHNALADAHHQAKWLCNIHRKIGLGFNSSEPEDKPPSILRQDAKPLEKDLLLADWDEP